MAFETRARQGNGFSLKQGKTAARTVRRITEALRRQADDCVAVSANHVNFVAHLRYDYAASRKFALFSLNRRHNKLLLTAWPTRDPTGYTQMATLHDITAKIKDAVGADPGLGKTLKLNLKDDGVIFIDGGTVSNEDKPADLTITVSLDNLLAMASGRLKPAFAIMVGKMQCSNLGGLMALEDRLTDLIARLD